MFKDTQGQREGTQGRHKKPASLQEHRRTTRPDLEKSPPLPFLVSLSAPY
jgi:hypothetical protein